MILKTGNDKFVVVDSFPYLGDSIGQLGSCFETKIDRVRGAWKSFPCMLPVLTSSGVSLKAKGHMHTMPAFVVSCCMLVKLGPLK